MAKKKTKTAAPKAAIPQTTPDTPATQKPEVANPPEPVRIPKRADYFYNDMQIYRKTLTLVNQKFAFRNREILSKALRVLSYEAAKLKTERKTEGEKGAK
jgi:hypothetical protein